MLSKEQETKIIERIIETVNVFYSFDCKISDDELSQVLNQRGISTSSTTVGNDLRNVRIKELFSQIVYDDIAIRRKENKKLGNIKGGVISQKNNDYLKKEDGKFNGSEKK